MKKTIFDSIFGGMPTVRLPLQYFADGEGAGGGSDGGSEGGSSDGGNSGSSDNTPPTFAELLSGNKDYQSAHDKIVNKALETARAKWEAEKQAEISEAKKLEKMNAEQKAEYERKQAEKALKEREAAITRRELTQTAKEQLAELKLPTKLASVLDYSSAENCSASIETVAAAFNEAVAQAVEERLKGRETPKIGANNQNGENITGIAAAYRYDMQHRN